MSDQLDPLSVGVPPERIKQLVTTAEAIDAAIRQRYVGQIKELQERLAEATAKLEKAWQPIETAPKDGRTVIVWPLRVFASWDARFNEWISGEDGCALTPTHWHPAPPPAPGEALASVSPPPSQDEHALYMELLLAVVRKHPSESRHQTALRYIRDAERRVGGPASSPPPSQETREPEQEEKDDTRAGEPVTRPPARATAPTD